MKIYVSGKSAKISETNVEHETPKIFSGDTLSFQKNGRSIYSGGGLNCSQCGNRIWHGQVGYCIVYKRIVASNETCSQNTRTKYNRVNF